MATSTSTSNSHPWVRYWGSDSSTGTSTSTTGWVSDMEYTNCTTSGTWDHYPRAIAKRVLVKSPQHWTKKINDLFVPLINDETNTGWKITALMREIEIVDPMIDVREMKDFLGLLKARASAADCKKIDAFFAKHGLHGKPKRKTAKK